MRVFLVAIALSVCLGQASAQTPQVTLIRDPLEPNRIIQVITVEPATGTSVIDLKYVDENGVSTGYVPYFIRLNNGPWVKIPEPSKWPAMAAQMRAGQP
jgi:hypothetical protein